MMMLGKKFVINCVCVLIVGCASAQQQPYYTQYILNNFILNPALAGIENYWDFKVSYRNQWVGLQGSTYNIVSYGKRSSWKNRI